MEYTQISFPINPVVSLSVKSENEEIKSITETHYFPPQEPDKKKKSLEETALKMEHFQSSSSFLIVPPSTPAPIFSFENLESPVNTNITNIEECKFPYIREVGIKNCLDTLSVYFQCPDYKVNKVQFWFLDVIADCLWKLQDEFQFPEPYQKIVIEWILFLVDLIRDPQRNLTRKEFFRIFNEAVVVAKEKVQSGCDMLPSPKELFSVINEEEDVISIYSSYSTFEEKSTVTAKTEGSYSGSYLAVGMDESPEIFKLPKEYPVTYQHESTPNIEKFYEEEFEEETLSLESIEFYQADPNTPERFLSSSSSSYISVPGEDDYFPIKQNRFLWKEASVTNTKKECPDVTNQKISELQQERGENSEVDVNQTDIKEEWKSYLEDRKEYVNSLEKNILINNCALFAIKQFVYDYFYESFQYTVVQYALINRFTTITQSINKQWCIPKVLKKELKKPKPKKEKKKKKPKKAKKPRKKTKSKKDKKRKRKDKKRKGKKKPKKPKKKKLTKEEKAELARQKKREKKLEEQRRIEEENRRSLFPLKDATTDDFFREIFDHWVKPKHKKRKKEKKKGKKKK